MTRQEKAWAIPDCLIPEKSTGETSHESICILNRSTTPGWFIVEAYFAESEKLVGEEVAIMGERCVHLRTDDPAAIGGLSIPIATPYGLVVRTSSDLMVQYSRLDTTQAAYALMSIVPQEVAS